MLNEDRKALEQRLADLNTSGRVAFAASCAERVAPVWSADRSEAARRSQDRVTALVQKCWDTARHARSILSEADADELVALVGDGQDMTGPGPLAQDANLVIVFAVKCAIEGSAESAAFAAQHASDLIVSLVEPGNPVDLGRPETFDFPAWTAWIDAQPLMKTEVEKQKSDLVRLAAVGDPESELLDELRAESFAIAETLRNEALRSPLA